MTDFVADFETSKIIKFVEQKDKKKIFDEDGNFLLPKAVFRFDENLKKLISGIYKFRKVDVKNSKTWVYHFGIEKLDTTGFFEGYCIDDFMKFIENYPDDMTIYFHNEKFDGSFILYYMLKHPEKYRQLVEAKNKDFLIEKSKRECLNLNASLLEPFYNKKQQNIEKYDALKMFKKYGLITSKNRISTCLVDGIFFNESVNKMGVMYSIILYIMRKGQILHTVEIRDSLKLLNFSVAQLGKDFLNEKLPKLKIDYDVVRPEKRPDLLTQEDHDYLKRDLDIVAKCLTILFNSKDIDGIKTKSTIASLALDDWKTLRARKVLNKMDVTTGEKEKVFRETFPVFKTELVKNEKTGELEYINEIDDYVRQAYKGGFCYDYKIHKTTEDHKGINYSSKGMCVLDVNSLFPYIMYDRPMPCGMPVIVRNQGLNKKGYLKKVVKDDEVVEELYDYFIVHLKVKFKLKPNHIPSIMLKGRDIVRNFGDEKPLLPTQKYLESSGGDFLDLIMTKDDYELMIEQYDIFDEENKQIDEKDIEIIEVYYFKTIKNVFKEYIEKWAKIKIEAGKEKNTSRRALAKLFLNSLYGKFGSKVRNAFKFFYVDEKNKLNSFSKIENVDEPLYTPVAAAITAGGRRYTIETAQKILNYGLKKYGKYVFCYSDTDSIHTTLCRDDVIDCLGDIVDVDKTGNFGLWDIEEDDIKKSKFIRPKTYMEERKDGTIKTGVAGLPSEIQSCLTWESFEEGVILVGKLQPVQVEGGTALIESTFEIK